MTSIFVAVSGAWYEVVIKDSFFRVSGGRMSEQGDGDQWNFASIAGGYGCRGSRRSTSAVRSGSSSSSRWPEPSNTPQIRMWDRVCDLSGGVDRNQRVFVADENQRGLFDVGQEAQAGPAGAAGELQEVPIGVWRVLGSSPGQPFLDGSVATDDAAVDEGGGPYEVIPGVIPPG